MRQLIVVLVVIAIGIIRMLAENAARQRRQRQLNEAANMKPDDRAKVQSEIEAFLEGVSGKKQAPAAAPNQPRRQTRSEQRKQQKPKRQQPPRESDSSSSRSRAPVPPGRGVQQHVESYIGQHVSEHIGTGISKHVQPEIVDSGQKTPGVDDAAMMDQLATSEIRKMLQSPEGMRQAIIAAEVISRPRSMRRSSG